MIFKKKDNDKVDVESLNNILFTGKKIMKIGYFMAVVCLILLATYLVKEWKILHFVGNLLVVISPIFIGLIIAWLLDPLVDWFEKKVPRVVGCIIVYILLLGGIFLFFYLLAPNFVHQVKDFGRALPDILKEIVKFSNGLIDGIEKTFNYNLGDAKKQIYASLNDFGINFTTNLPTYLMSIGKSFVSGVINFGLGLMIGFYMLYDFDRFNSYIRKMIPKSWKKNYSELGSRLNTSLRNYVSGVFIVMFLVFVTQSIGLTLAGLEAPMLFALFCAVTDIIPYFGPYIGAIPAIIVGFTISPITGICCIISIIIVQILENNFYQPLIMGHTMKLHPVTIMVGLLVFQHFFGILGMIIATPVIACLKVILMFIDEKLDITGRVSGESNDKEKKDRDKKDREEEKEEDEDKFTVIDEETNVLKEIND